MYILCANDRFNYGDLLFPFIIEYYFKEHINQFIFCSTTESDLREYGAVPTKDFSCLTRLSPWYINILMIGGGECIFCNWKDILNYVGENITNIQDDHFPTKYPFTISKDELPNINLLMYNSVGCHQLNERQELYGDHINKEILGSADYIAVRDSPTSLGVSRMNLVHYICPDSAIIISKLFNKQYLDKHSSYTVKEIQQHEYLFFQIGLVHIKGNERVYANILNNIYKEKKLRICLCPIGTAKGHDDPIALEQIAEYLKPESYTLVHNPSIWDIMSLISGSRIYVGTSLHGAITAMSYSVPLIAHGPKKLQAYIETWYDTIGSEYSFVSIDNLEKEVLRRIDTRFTISPNKQMELIEESFERMQKIIEDTINQ